MNRPTALALALAGLLGPAAAQARSCEAPAAAAAAAQHPARQPDEPTVQDTAAQNPAPARAGMDGMDHACMNHDAPSPGAAPETTDTAAAEHGDAHAGMAHAPGMDHSTMHAGSMHPDEPSSRAAPATADADTTEPGDAHAGMAHTPGMDHPAMHHGSMQHDEPSSHADPATADAAAVEHGDAHAGMAHAPGMDHPAMHAGRMQHDEPSSHADPATADTAAAEHGDAHAGMVHTPGMDPSAMHHGDAPSVAAPLPPPTAAERAAAFPVLQSHAMHGTQANHYVLLDRLEGWDADPGTGQAWEATAWYGGDVNRLWLRSEGERSGGRTGSAQLEALYGRAISPWWDVLVGVRHDTRPEGRTWAAVGLQGLAPYKFELAGTLYVSDHGDGALRLESEYDVLLTNRLILQPRIEAEVGFGGDRARGPASGLQSVEAGLRLRYEITRRFAPYVGWVHERRFGTQADRARAQDDAPRDSRWVAGVRLWF